MPSVTFEGDTHDEIVAQVRRWLESAVPQSDEQLSPQQAIAQGAEVTKDALRIIAAASPAPVAQNELVKLLTEMGYRATDTTRDALVDGIDQLRGLTGDGVVSTAGDKASSVVYEMNAQIAKQLLRSLRAGR